MLQFIIIILNILNFCSLISSLEFPEDVINKNKLFFTADYDYYKFINSENSELIHYSQKFNNKNTNNENNTEFIAHIAVFNANYLSLLPPISTGCYEYLKTSESSKNYKCEYATNGGFFVMNSEENKDNLCVGNLISNYKIFVNEGNNYVNIGINGNNEIIIGYIDNNVINSFNIKELISGRGWLIRNHINYVNSSLDLNINSNFVNIKAPRTAIGVFDNNSLLLIQIDGQEDINYGPDLYEFANVLLELQVKSAINLDGGGSSVSVYNNNVISTPTCVDNSTVCEREVQSITCVNRNN